MDSSWLWGVLVCGVLALLYGAWATKSVLAESAGNARMQLKLPGSAGSVGLVISPRRNT